MYMLVLFMALAFCIWASAKSQEVSSPSDVQDSNPRRPDSPLGGREAFAGDAACQRCHENESATFLQTRHHRTSQLAEAASVAGKFGAGENSMQTVNPELSFRMEAKDGSLYQIALLEKPGHRTVRSEKFAIVVGSGRKGQTYLYWKEDRLYELPVSYWTELNQWVNSPGYVDGSADFDRSITPRCVECHATYFQTLPASGLEAHFDKTNFVLGISCERCHGPGGEHVRDHLAGTLNDRKTMAPVNLKRERQIEVCAQCHGGVGEQIAPAFSFMPGEQLSNYVKLRRPDPGAKVDVHGNQVALLERSRCFQVSSAMTCSTCHDVHAPERAAAAYSERCLHCHQEKQCGMYAAMGAKIAANCVDCHMPVQESNQLVLDVDDKRLGAKVRNHRIAVYPQNRSSPRFP
jgi:hypothetical protein